jgi:hypothetical protein
LMNAGLLHHRPFCCVRLQKKRKTVFSLFIDKFQHII